MLSTVLWMMENGEATLLIVVLSLSLSPHARVRACAKTVRYHRCADVAIFDTCIPSTAIFDADKIC